MSERLSHRLSVVWFTDLVGYSNLSARDQDRALALVQRFQRLVGRTVPSTEGRVVKFMGDAALLESPTAESALDAARALHAEMGEGLRTGIHLDEVVVGPDGDLYGDGVNGAQRIQTAAEPGQIVVSEDVWRRMRNRPAYVFEPLGERQLKGIEPMELFRLVSVGTTRRAASETGAPRAAPSGGAAYAAAARPSVAVLPFTNMSTQPDNEYFSDGVTEEILTLLTRVEGLKVISRTSVMQYKGTVKPIRQIGAELGVAAILEGSVRHAGSRVRITAQLVDAANDEHLWAERYDRELEDIFAIQSDVAERIVEALRLRLTSRERSRLAEKPTQSVDAYRWYLKGRHFVSRRTEATLRQAADSFRRAVAADPQFAQAWVGVADAQALLVNYARAASPGALDDARAAAQKALSLDPRLGEAYASLGMIATTEWKWQEADVHFTRARQLSPAYVPALHWYAGLLYSRGRLDEAMEVLARASDLDPLSLPVHMATGLTLYGMGRFEEALEVYRKAIDLDPGFAPVYGNLAGVYMSQGRLDQALAALTTLSRLNPVATPPDVLDQVRAGYEARGASGFWAGLLEGVASQAAEMGSDVDHELAIACVHLGRFDDAFAHLERLVDARHPVAASLAVEPQLAPLRDDPRFTELKRRVGLE